MLLSADQLSVLKILQGQFMGLLGLALVNAYVTHVECSKRAGAAARTRAEFVTELHSQLVAVEASDFAGASDEPTPTRRSTGPRIWHTIAMNDEWSGEGKERKRHWNS